MDDADTNPAEEVKTVELTAANGWKASVSNLPKYKDGQMYEYFWTEKEGNIPDGYGLTNEVTYDIFSSEKGVTGFITTLTNSHRPQKISATVKKVWDDNNNKAGVRPASIQVQLYADETPQGNPVKLNEENSWKYTWKDLDKYADGTEISYRVDEVGDRRLSEVCSANEDKTEYVITNTITSVKITKVDISDAHELEGAHLQILIRMVPS
ncbi:MAG: Cna B-type domain-containing protein [Lachnospiraceae bacterium]